MIPYREAGKKILEREEVPLKTGLALGKAAIGSAGVSAAGYAGANLMKRALPFLSKFIPESTAIKGLDKIDKRFGDFAKKALEAGYDFEEVKDFIEKKSSEKSTQKENSQENKNIIEQYSPELFQFIQDNINQGKDLMQAGALAQNDSRFANIVQKISKDHKTNWSSILQTVFGNMPTATSQNQMVESNMQNQQGMSAGQQAIIQQLQRINQAIGK